MSCQKPNGDSKILCRHLLFSPMAPFSHYQYKNTSTGCRRQTAQLIVRTGSYDPVLTFSSAPMMHWPFLLQSSLFSSICLYTTLHSIIISITYYQSLVLFHSVSCLPPITPNWTQLIADPGVGFLPIKSFFFFFLLSPSACSLLGCIIKGSLPYNVTLLWAMVIVTWCYLNKTELKWALNVSMGTASSLSSKTQYC